jgi:hypothetical protein
MNFSFRTTWCPGPTALGGARQLPGAVVYGKGLLFAVLWLTSQSDREIQAPAALDRVQFQAAGPLPLLGCAPPIEEG